MTAEQIAIQRGMELGIQQGIQQALELAMELKFSMVGLDFYYRRIKPISDLDKLQELRQAIRLATKLEELETIL